MNPIGVRRFRKLRVIIKSLKQGVPITQGCKAANIDPSTLWEWRQKNERLGLLINKIIDSRVQMVEDALFKSALAGDVGAQREWLHNRAPERWTADKKTLINNTINNSSVSSVNANLVNLSEKELDDLANNIVTKRQSSVNPN